MNVLLGVSASSANNYNIKLSLLPYKAVTVTPTVSTPIPIDIPWTKAGDYNYKTFEFDIATGIKDPTTL